MAISATLSLDSAAGGSIAYTNVGQTATGAAFRDPTRELALPRILECLNQIGNPGSKGNDHVIINMKNSKLNSTTSAVVTGSCKLDISIPRDDAWDTADSQDFLSQISDLMSSTAATAAFVTGLMV